MVYEISCFVWKPKTERYEQELFGMKQFDNKEDAMAALNSVVLTEDIPEFNLYEFDNSGFGQKIATRFLYEGKECNEI